MLSKLHPLYKNANMVEESDKFMECVGLGWKGVDLALYTI